MEGPALGQSASRTDKKCRVRATVDGVGLFLQARLEPIVLTCVDPPRRMRAASD